MGLLTIYPVNATSDLVRKRGFTNGGYFTCKRAISFEDV
jgi:hypothetical protein